MGGVKFTYPKVRDIDWTHEGEWLVPDGESFTTKMLTNITRFPDFVSKLFVEAGVDMPDKPRQVGTRYLNLVNIPHRDLSLSAATPYASCPARRDNL